MVLTDVIEFLKSAGFSNLDLKKVEGKTYDFKFHDFKKSTLDKIFGAPSVTSNKKVYVYELKNVARLGVSPATNLVRIIDLTKEEGPKADDSHLGHVKVTPKLTQLFYKAQSSATYRIPYMIELWKYLNAEKFGSKMELPSLKIGAPISKARGVYTGAYKGPGTIHMAPFMFNAREPFFLEVFLHEMCHAAVWEIDHISDNTEKGHGPDWQRWMSRVGLDPRRFDPTDDTEYKTVHEQKSEELELTEKYGPRVDDTYFKKLVPVTNPILGQPVIFSYKGRPIGGTYAGKKGSKRIVNGGPIKKKTRPTIGNWTLGPSTQLYLLGDEA
jgi:hypothetical protein